MDREAHKEKSWTALFFHFAFSYQQIMIKHLLYARARRYSCKRNHWNPLESTLLGFSLYSFVGECFKSGIPLYYLLYSLNKVFWTPLTERLFSPVYGHYVST